MIKTGEPAPPFSLTDGKGERVTLKDLAGKHVVLYFYPKDDTPGCTKEACRFRDSFDELQDLGAVVLGVSPDSAESHTRFAEKYRLPFRLLSDPDKKVMQDYDAWGEKTSYGKTTTGVIRSTVWIGPDGRVVRHWPRVSDAETHPDQVLAALKSGL
ncbi:MAG TPA: peroxiredoxin [Gemmatimonadales bacterium]|jgi:peroxiredoxin Q/BCP